MRVLDGVLEGVWWCVLTGCYRICQRVRHRALEGVSE